MLLSLPHEPAHMVIPQHQNYLFAPLSLPLDYELLEHRACLIQLPKYLNK